MLSQSLMFSSGVICEIAARAFWKSYRAQYQQQCIIFLFLFDFSIIFSCEMRIVMTADLAAGTKLRQPIPAVGDQPACWLLHPFHGSALGPPPPSLLLHSVLCWVMACCRCVQDHVLRSPQSGSAAQLSSRPPFNYFLLNSVFQQMEKAHSSAAGRFCSAYW